MYLEVERNRYRSIKTLVMCPDDGVNFWRMANSCQRSLTRDTLAKAMLDGSPQENLRVLASAASSSYESMNFRTAIGN